MPSVDATKDAGDVAGGGGGKGGAGKGGAGKGGAGKTPRPGGGGAAGTARCGAAGVEGGGRIGRGRAPGIFFGCGAEAAPRRRSGIQGPQASISSSLLVVGGKGVVRATDKPSGPQCCQRSSSMRMLSPKTLVTRRHRRAQRSASSGVHPVYAMRSAHITMPARCAPALQWMSTCSPRSRYSDTCKANRVKDAQAVAGAARMLRVT